MAASLENAIIDPLEKIFDSVGAMEGSTAPLKRAAIGAAVGYGIAYGLHPDFAWNADGSQKPFAGTADKKDALNATWFPVWAIIAAPAIVFSVFI